MSRLVFSGTVTRFFFFSAGLLDLLVRIMQCRVGRLGGPYSTLGLMAGVFMHMRPMFSEMQQYVQRPLSAHGCPGYLPAPLLKACQDAHMNTAHPEQPVDRCCWQALLTRQQVCVLSPKRRQPQH